MVTTAKCWNCGPMDSSFPKSTELLLTKRGREWLAQFDSDDHETADRLVDSLTLVSHSAFERALTELIQTHSAEIDGPVALFAAREIDPSSSYFEQAKTQGKDNTHLRQVNALAPGSDHGSEARIAAMIRNIAKAERKKFLNHPNIAKMRTAKCRAVFVVDDFIGSGKRALSFLDAMWQDTSI
jgi:hypothetical protein